MRTVTFVNQIPEQISESQLFVEIFALHPDIKTIYSPEKAYIINDEVAVEPRSIVCYNVPNEITDLQIKQIINAHVPEVEEVIE